jgi:hypothetical protein
MLVSHAFYAETTMHQCQQYLPDQCLTHHHHHHHHHQITKLSHSINAIGPVFDSMIMPHDHPDGALILTH